MQLACHIHSFIHLVQNKPDTTHCTICEFAKVDMIVGDALTETMCLSKSSIQNNYFIFGKLEHHRMPKMDKSSASVEPITAADTWQTMSIAE